MFIDIPEKAIQNKGMKKNDLHFAALKAIIYLSKNKEEK
jgi:hypothetical protein